MKDREQGSHMSLLSTAKKLISTLQIVILFHSCVTKAFEANWKLREGIREALIKHYIIPDVMAVAPGNLATVMYSSFAVNMGNKVDPRICQHMPSVWWPSEEGCHYALLMIDCDVPSRRNPQYRARQHWVVVNIPRVDIYQGKTLTEYIGPITPRNSGLHRNVFVVFKQKELLTTDEPFISLINRGPNTRTRFSVRNFSAKYKLSDPIAVNFFRVGYPIYKDKEMRHSWVRNNRTSFTRYDFVPDWSVSPKTSTVEDFESKDSDE